MTDRQIVIPPCNGAHADCLPNFHNPPGQPCICVPNEPPQPVPTLDTWALIGMLVIVCATGLVWIWRRRWTA